MKNQPTLPLRPCAGIVLFNKNKEIFIGSRIDMPNQFWQMPQGGIDEGEKPLDAAVREMGEEIGTVNARLIQESKDWLEYELPSELIGKMWGGKYRGQIQKWFLFEFLGEDREINLETPHPEFKEWKWAKKDYVLQNAIPFKQDVYQKVLGEFSNFL